MGDGGANRFDVIVLGVGAMGAAACWHLAARGARVLGLEQAGIPNVLGSSHGYTRAIRMAYYEHPDYVPLLRRAYALWKELEAASGQRLLHITGGLYLGPRGAELVEGSRRSAVEHGLDHEVLDRSQIARRFPLFEVPDDYGALLEPAAGFLRPELAVAAMAQLALRAGAELHGTERVAAWRATDSGVLVQTARGAYHAAQLICCPGPWSGEVVADLGVPLVVTRQVMGWVWPRRPEAFALGHFPTWALSAPDGRLYYGFPMLPDSPGLKVAQHGGGRPSDRETIARTPEPGDEDGFLTPLRRYLPDGDGPVLSARVCMYTNSPDSHFIVDRHPVYRQVLVACGFSGHGFKFAPVIGEALADLALRGSTPLPVGFLGLSRFARA